MSSQEELRVEVEVEDEADDRELEELTLELERELLELEVDAVAPATTVAPDGSRGDPVTLGALLVKLGPGALRSVVGTIKAFVKRSAARSVRIEIDGDVLEVTGISPEDQERLIDSWLERRTRE